MEPDCSEDERVFESVCRADKQYMLRAVGSAAARVSAPQAMLETQNRSMHDSNSPGESDVWILFLGIFVG